MKKVIILIVIVFLFSNLYPVFGQEKKDKRDQIQHKSGYAESVHQFYAGEAAKIWPGWNGIKNKYTLTIENIYCDNADIEIQEEIYIKFIINDQWRLLDNNGNFYKAKRDCNIFCNDLGLPDILYPEFDNNNTFSIELNEFEPIVISIIIIEKDLLDDKLICKYNRTFIQSEFPNEDFDYIIQELQALPETVPLRSIDIKIKIRKTDVSNAISIPTQAEKEINDHIGTRLIYDTNPPGSGEDKFVGTYSGNINDYHIIFPEYAAATDKSYENNIYAFWDAIPNNNITHLTHTDHNNGINRTNDIIDGCMEEDEYNPEYKPDHIWEGIPENKNSSTDVTMFSNHFWEPDINNNGNFTTGGHSLLSGLSAYHKASLYWDYYVIYKYYNNDIDLAYYYLGRIVHLLQDMSSNPHVHGDPHLFKNIEVDIAEKYIHGNPIENESPDITWYKINEKCISFENIKEYIDGSIYSYDKVFIDNNCTPDAKPFNLTNSYDEWEKHFSEDWSCWGENSTNPVLDLWNSMDPLFYLFYSMAETTDNYPSKDYDGDYINHGIPLAKWLYTENGLKQNWEHVADRIIPKMMSHVAGLYRLFWVSTHFPMDCIWIDGKWTYTDYLEDSNPEIAEKMKKAYVEAFESGIYIGSPSGTYTVDEVTVDEVNSSHYKRNYNHGGLFYNNDAKSCFYIGEGIWKKWLELDIEDIGIPLNSEYVDFPSGYPRVDFEKGSIIWKDGAAEVIDQTEEVTVEYFFDIDPGCGNGTALSANSNRYVYINTNIDLTNGEPGLHRLYVRAKNEDGKWGIPQSKSILVQDIEETSPPADITKVEYFFDTDPDWDNGTDLPITPGEEVDISRNINLTGLDEGLHRLYVRAMNEDLKWGIVQSKSILVQDLEETIPPPNIAKVEYFFDDDPGLGSGTNLDLTPASEVDINENLNLASIDEGLHRLYVRAMNEENKWGNVQSKSVLVQDMDELLPPPDLTKVEYFFDDDPGLGNGLDFSIVPGEEVNIDDNIDLSETDEGLHRLYVRGMNAEGNWGISQSKSLLVQDIDPLGPLPNITELEYFIDEDPGIGLASKISILEGPFVDYSGNIPIDLFEPGDFNLYVRAKDETGTWGFPRSTMFTIDPHDLIDFHVLLNGDKTNEFCPLDDATFIGITYLPVQTWSWDFGDGIVENTGPSIIHEFCDRGVYNVTLTVTYIDGVEVSLSKTLSVNLDLSCPIQIHVNDIVACKGEDVQFVFEPIICNGQPLKSIISGGSGDFAYYWEPNQHLDNFDTESPIYRNAQVSNDYTLTVTDNVTGSEASALVSMSVNQPPIITIPRVINMKKSESAYLGEKLKINKGQEPFSYFWTDKGTWTSSESNPNVSPDITTTYYITVTDANGCQSSEKTVIVRVRQKKDSEIQTYEFKESFIQAKVYPNPASTRLNIDINLLETAECDIRITNLLGQEMVYLKNTGNSIYSREIDIESLRAGVYIIEIISNGEIIKEKIVKE